MKQLSVRTDNLGGSEHEFVTFVSFRGGVAADLSFWLHIQLPKRPCLRSHTCLYGFMSVCKNPPVWSPQSHRCPGQRVEVGVQGTRVSLPDSASYDEPVNCLPCGMHL